MDGFYDLGNEDFGNQFQATEVELAEKTLGSDPRNQETYKVLLESYANMCDMEKLHATRLKMAQNLLVSPITWLEWFQDALDDDDEDNYIELWEESVKHYMSPALWMHRLPAICGKIIDEDGDLDFEAVETARALCERAVRAVGGDVLSGSEVWRTYQNLETTVLAKSLPENDENNDDEDEVPEEAAEAIERIKSLWRRQIQSPSLSCAETYNEYNEWQAQLTGKATHDLKDVYLGMHKYIKRVRDRETALLELKEDENEERMALWVEYIQEQEKRNENVERVQSLYERALADCADEPENLWSMYTRFAMENRLVDRFAICWRSVKRLPLAAPLWARLVACADATEDAEAKVEEIWASTSGALDGTGVVALTIERANFYCKKELPDKTRAVLKEGEALVLELVANIRKDLYRFWCNVECFVLKDAGKTRALCEKLLKADKRTSTWNYCIQMLRHMGQLTAARSLLKRGLIAVGEEGFDGFCAEWQLFEQIHGDNKTQFEALKKIESQRVKIEQIKSKRRAQQKGKSKKRKREEEALAAKKRTKLSAESAKPKTAPPKKTSTDGAPPGYDAPPGFTSPPDNDLPPGYGATPGFASEKKQAAEKMEVDEPAPAVSKMQSRTLFVVNIPKALKYETELEKICSEFGTVTSVRCPRGKKGKVLKGIGYVEFETVEACVAAQQALQGTKLGKKPLRVEKYRNPNDGTVMHKTLFVRGIKKLKDPRTALKKFLEPCGDITEVRVAFDKSNQNKGFAYVQFVKAKSVAKALEMEDPTLQGYTLSLQKCKEKKKVEKPPEQSTKQFVPRTLNKAKRTQIQRNQEPKQQSQGGPAPPESSNLSNNDFRKFLM